MLNLLGLNAGKEQFDQIAQSHPASSHPERSEGSRRKPSGDSSLRSE
jgi:hypothetical protein